MIWGLVFGRRSTYFGKGFGSFVLVSLAALTLCCGMVGCGSDDSGASSGGVDDAAFKAACDNGVVQCKDDPTYGQMFGAQDCSNIAATYAGCDSNCRAGAKPIIDCQMAASTCAAFAACVQQPSS